MLGLQWHNVKAFIENRHMKKLNILIVYFYNQYPMRAAVQDHLYSFQENSEHRCFFYNAALSSLPAFFTKLNFDLIIFHNLFMIRRWYPEQFRILWKKIEPLKKISAPKAVMIQDDYLNPNIVCEFTQEFGVTTFFTVAPQSEWKKLFSQLDPKVQIYEVLTGYLSEKTLQKINHLAQKQKERSIDIGYRAWPMQPFLGKHGQLKTILAEKFQEKAPHFDLKTDISAKQEDTVLGDDWYRFLLSCKYTISVEGGASLMDLDGKILKTTQDYLKTHPHASFEDVEKVCFPNQDGNLKLFALSPRHLEACATHTCQILIEGEYNGVLQAGKHYIELKKDFSNLNDVLTLVKEDLFREQITKQAYQDIVASKKYSYKNFVDFVIEKSMQDFPQKNCKMNLLTKIFLLFRRPLDQLSWFFIALRHKLRS